MSETRVNTRTDRAPADESASKQANWLSRQWATTPGWGRQLAITVLVIFVLGAAAGIAHVAYNGGLPAAFHDLGNTAFGQWMQSSTGASVGGIVTGAAVTAWTAGLIALIKADREKLKAEAESFRKDAEDAVDEEDSVSGNEDDAFESSSEVKKREKKVSEKALILAKHARKGAKQKLKETKQEDPREDSDPPAPASPTKKTNKKKQ